MTEFILTKDRISEIQEDLLSKNIYTAFDSFEEIKKLCQLALKGLKADKFRETLAWYATPGIHERWRAEEAIIEFDRIGDE